MATHDQRGVLRARRPCDLAQIVRGVLPLIELQAKNRRVRIMATIDR